MRKVLTLMVFGLFVLSIAGIASATASPADSILEITTVAGTIYSGTIDNGVANLDVSVTCNGYVESETTGANGEYSVYFYNDECDLGDEVTVAVALGSETITKPGIITMENTDNAPFLTLNMGIVNVMVPEFGLVLGMLTALSAVGIFFMVRKD